MTERLGKKELHRRNLADRDHEQEGSVLEVFNAGIEETGTKAYLASSPIPFKGSALAFRATQGTSHCRSHEKRGPECAPSSKKHEEVIEP